MFVLHLTSLIIVSRKERWGIHAKCAKILRPLW